MAARFAVDRLEGLTDAPRPGPARTIGDEVIEAVLVDTLESAPAADTHWSTRSLAAKHHISHQTVADIWKAFGLKPWQQDRTFALELRRSCRETWSGCSMVQAAAVLTSTARRGARPDE